MDDAYRLQIGIDDRGANEGHPSFFEVGRNGIGEGGGCSKRKFLRHGLVAREAPDIIGEGAKFCLNALENGAVFYRGLDF